MKKTLLWIGIVVLLLALTLGLRLNFLSRHHQAPVVWDAAGYHLQAQEFVKAYRAWQAGDAQLMDQCFRKGYEMALPKCELYPLFVSAVYLFQGVDSSAARTAQAFLGTLSCFLLYLIAAKVFNRRVAAFSLLVAAFYVPFILSEGRLLTETVAIFVLLLTNWLLLLSLDKGRWYWIFLAGFATALMVITRTFFQYIFYFYWPLLLVGLIVRKIRWSFLRSLLFWIGFGLIIVPRLLWTPEIDRHHRRLISGSWRNGLAMYCGIYPPHQGLQSDGDPGGDILREVIREKRGRSLDDNYLEAYKRLLLTRPHQAVPVLLSKGWLFWQRAYNDFHQTYLLSPRGIDIFNRVLLTLGLFGLATLFCPDPRRWVILLTSLYIWGMCFLADAESRYTLPAMPFMIAAGVWFLAQVGRGLKALRRQAREGKKLFRRSLVLSLVLILLCLVFRPPFTLQFFSPLSFIAAYRIWVLLASLFLLSLIPLLLVLYRPIFPAFRRRVAAIVPPLFLLAVYLSALKVHPSWHQWKIRLQDRQEVIRQKIELPNDLRRYRTAELKLDMVSGPGRQYDLTVKVDGDVVRRFERGLAPDPAAYIVSRRAFPIYLREHKRTFPDVKQWFTIPLDITKLEGKKSIEVEVVFSPRHPASGNYVEFYGDYPFSSDPLLFEGPTFSQSPSELSLYRYLFDDDWRLWRRVSLSGPVESSYPGVGRVRDDDLSTEPGIQKGRYRIILLLSRKAPESRGFEVRVTSTGGLLTQKTILADYYNMQLWEVNPWKRTGDKMLLEAAHAAPGEEGGFRLVAYADSDGDGKPDRLIGESEYLQAEKAGEWSSWKFETEEKNIFVGMTWPKGSKTKVYYERALWPDGIFPEVMYYRTGPHAPKANPVLTNMRLIFLSPEKSEVK